MHSNFLGPVALRWICAVVAMTAVGCGGRFAPIDRVPLDLPDDPRTPVRSLDASPPASSCERPNVIVDDSSPAVAAISRSDAILLSRGLATGGSPKSSSLVRVTIRTGPGTPTTTAEIKRDLTGEPIDGRPAWILRFVGQAIPLPGGVPEKPGASLRTGSVSYVTSLVAVIDAVTGDLIYGYSCGVATTP